jgi:hypothetical protein
MTDQSNTSSQFIIVLDEMGYYHPALDDRLIETLRDLEGVENAEYVVAGDMIFVFNKLVSLVKKHLKEHPGADPREFAPAMVPAATMPIADAVKNWRVVPLGFKIERVAWGFRILHTELKAHLPKDFATMDEANDALVSLLKDESIPGDGSFAYRGQNYIYTHSMDPDLLPEKPEVLRKCPAAQRTITTLGGTQFFPGFSPVSKARFERIQAIEKRWVNDRERIKSDALHNIDKLWRLLENFSWEACDGVDAEIPEYGREDLIKLRKLYHGLKRLSDKSLYHNFDAFQSSCRYLNNWEPSYDTGFLFYLLGQYFGWDTGGPAQEEFGEFAGHAILSGLPFAEALNWAEAAQSYDTSVRKLAWRTDCAMRFLKAEKDRVPGRGPEVFTMTDLYVRSRSIGVTPIEFVAQ